MRHAGLCALAVLAALTAASPPDTDSSEELRQALVLVDILRSGMSRRKTATIASVPAPVAVPRNNAHVGLPPLYGAPYYGHGAPFRRFYGNAGGPDGRRVQNAGRQLQYDESFGAHPGNDEQDENRDSTTVQSTSKVLDEHSTTISSTIMTESSTVTDGATTAVTTNTKPTITTVTKRVPKITDSETTQPFSVATTAQKTQTSTNFVTKSSNTVEDLDPTSVSVIPTPEMKKLNYLKEDKFRKKVSKKERKVTMQSGYQIEMSQAAEELRREATDTKHGVRHMSGGHPWRYRGTTRVHLARSSPLPRPLPVNNAFCHTNPDSPLCRTFI